MEYEENDRVELKREMIDDLDKEIIAFLNSKGGTIYIGVEDDGTVVGVPNELKDMYDQKLSSMITEGIKPSPRQFIKFKYNESKVLVIEINEGEKKPYYLSSKGPKPSGTYIRVGRSKQQAYPEEIVDMIKDSTNYSFEEEISKEQNLTFDTLNKFAKKNNLIFNVQKYKTLKIKNEHDFSLI